MVKIHLQSRIAGLIPLLSKLFRLCYTTHKQGSYEVCIERLRSDAQANLARSYIMRFTG
jgi:hypothetical protein